MREDLLLRSAPFLAPPRAAWLLPVDFGSLAEVFEFARGVRGVKVFEVGGRNLQGNLPQGSTCESRAGRGRKDN